MEVKDLVFTPAKEVTQMFEKAKGHVMEVTTTVMTSEQLAEFNLKYPRPAVKERVY